MIKKNNTRSISKLFLDQQKEIQSELEKLQEKIARKL